MKTLLYAILLNLAICTFSHAQTFYITGRATQDVPGIYNLTPAEYWLEKEATSAIWANQVINFNTSFELTFKVKIDLVGGTGADGFCLVFGEHIRLNSINGEGGNMGYYNMKWANPDFLNSFAVEIDHYPNDEANDPDPYFDHMMISRNGNAYNVIPGGEAVPIYSSQATIEDGNFNEYKVTWNCANNQFRVFFNDSLRIDCSIDHRALFDDTKNIHWGFTGAAAGSFSNHIIKDIKLTVTNSCGNDDIFVLYPTSNYRYNLTGTTSGHSVVRINIYNSLGQLVYKDNILPDNYHISQSISLGNVSEGIYYARIAAGQKIQTIKFLVGDWKRY